MVTIAANRHRDCRVHRVRALAPRRQHGRRYSRPAARSRRVVATPRHGPLDVDGFVAAQPQERLRMSTTSRALAFATLWFDAATVDSVFAPLVADWQREWQDAHPAYRALVSVRGLVAFAISVVISSPRILRTPVPSATRWTVTARITMFCLLVGGLLSIPVAESLAHARWNRCRCLCWCYLPCPFH